MGYVTAEWSVGKGMFRSENLLPSTKYFAATGDAERRTALLVLPHLLSINRRTVPIFGEYRSLHIPSTFFSRYGAHGVRCDQDVIVALQWQQAVSGMGNTARALLVQEEVVSDEAFIGDLLQPPAHRHPRRLAHDIPPMAVYEGSSLAPA